MNLGRLLTILVLLALAVLIALTIRAAIATESLIFSAVGLDAAGEWYIFPFGLCPLDSCLGGIIFPPGIWRWPFGLAIGPA